VTALLEYLDLTFMKCEKSAKKHKNNYSSKCFDVKCSNNVHCVHFTTVFQHTHCTFD